MFGGQKKPYTAITVQIENLTSEQFDENDLSGIVDLIEVIRLQSSGPTEAARAIRKKLKYGNVHRQLRALTILDGLIQNAGSRFQRVFVDEPLLERLRFCATDEVSDAEVKAKCKVLFGQWSVSFKNTPGMERVAALYKQLPQRKKAATQQRSKVLRETEEEAGREADEPSSPRAVITTTITGGAAARGHSRSISSTSGSFLSFNRERKDKSKGKAFNVEKEKPLLLQTLASASVASTNLVNSLRLINRENQRVSEDGEVMKRFETCKQLRRQVLRYIQVIDSEQWLGGLIHANDELVNALMAFEVLDKSVELDSDSEDEGSEAATQATRSRQGSTSTSGTAMAFAGLSLERRNAPPAPVKTERGGASTRQVAEREAEDDSESDGDEDEDDEEDPFADRNAVADAPDHGGASWRVV